VRLASQFAELFGLKPKKPAKAAPPSSPKAAPPSSPKAAPPSSPRGGPAEVRAPTGGR